MRIGLNYISTRGKAPTLSFEDVVLTGLASDGGLYVPESIPQFSRKKSQAFATSVTRIWRLKLLLHLLMVK